MKNQEDIGGGGEMLWARRLDNSSRAAETAHRDRGRSHKAAKAGDKAGQQKADEKWQQNGVEIADFLSKANPNWPRATLVDMMKTHLATTTDEVAARLTKNWDADVRAFDAVYEHILHMSDALSDGIVKQFPARFASATTSTR
jgi:hypothetical protein